MTPQQVIQSFMSSLDTHSFKLNNTYTAPTDDEKKALSKKNSRPSC